MSLYQGLPEEILVESVGHVRIVRLNRAEHMNAVNAGLHTGLTMVWRAIAADLDARAVVLTGAGEAFCGGGDLEWITAIQEDADLRYRMIRQAADVVGELLRCPVPIVAAVNGPAVGLGCSIVVGCDIVYMAQSSYLADPHVAIGVVAADGGVALWPMLTSMMNAKEYLFTGDPVPAEEAYRLGLANRVVPDAELFDEAIKFAQRLASLPPRALAETKRALNLHMQRAALGVLEFALAAESECFITQDSKDLVARLRDRIATKAAAGSVTA
jgi:enoyl-CoA hydratase